MNDRKIFILTLALSCSIIVALGVFSYIITMKQFGSDRLLSGITARRYNGVIIKKFEFDSVIAGSSLSDCFKCSDFDAAFGGRSIKLTLSGSNIAEIKFLLENAGKYHKIKRIMFDLPPAFLLREQNLNNIEKEYYTEDPHLFFLKKSFSLDHLGDSFRFLSRLCRKKVKYTNRDDIYRWDTKHSCSEKFLARDLLYSNTAGQYQFTDKNIAQAKKNVERFLIPLLENCSGSEIIIFFPPFSIMFYRNADVKRYIRLKGEYIDMLSSFKHVKIYDFETAFHITCNFNNYRDLTHYSAEINTWMISCMKEGKYLVTGKNKKLLLNKLEQRLLSYDFQKTFDRLKENYGKKQK